MFANFTLLLFLLLFSSLDENDDIFQTVENLRKSFGQPVFSPISISKNDLIDNLGENGMCFNIFFFKNLFLCFSNNN